MPLEVAFYSDALTRGQYGLGRYARDLLRALGEVSPAINVHPVSAHLSGASSPSPAIGTVAEHDCVRLPYRRKITAGLWSTIRWPRLERWTPWADVVHCVELDYPIATRKPLVVTIHDIGPLTHPEFFRTSHPWLLKAALKSTFDHAAAIICVSRATANSVEDYMNCSLGERLAIVPEGVSETFGLAVELHQMQATHDFAETGTPFFLWAGSVNPRKNLTRVIQAFEAVARDIPHHLVLAGGLGWDSNDVLRAIQNSVVAKRIHLPGRISEEELRGLYQRAAGFLYVSVMEGFGLPILEAMASGCPVITSNVSSMPEVAGDASLLVDPHQVQEIAVAMRELAFDSELAKRLSNLGRSRAQKFRWEHCAASIAGIYQKASSSSSLAAGVCPGLNPSMMKGRCNASP